MRGFFFFFFSGEGAGRGFQRGLFSSGFFLGAVHWDFEGFVI